jgi:hypothetical protein
MAILLAVGNYSVCKESHPIRNKKSGTVGMGNSGVGEFRIRKGTSSKPSLFPAGTKLHILGERALVIEPGAPTGEYETPFVDRQMKDGVYELDGHPRYHKVKNTTLSEMIGREVRYITASTAVEPVFFQYWTDSGGVFYTSHLPASNGAIQDDFAGTSRWYCVSSASGTNTTGAPTAVTAVWLENAAYTSYAHISGLSINIPAGDTLDYAWTHSIYSDGQGASNLIRDQISSLFEQGNAGNPSVPVKYVDVYASSVLKLSDIVVSYDPATGLPDFSSTYTNWYANNVLNNTGSAFTPDLIKVKETSKNVYAEITISGATSWTAGAYRNINFTIAWSDKP